MLGAYRAIPVPVLEAEAVIPPIQLQLDKMVMNSAALKGIHPVIIEGKRKIRKSLKGKRGRVRRLYLTPIDENEVQALRSLGVKSWDEASWATRRRKDQVYPDTDIEPFQDIANIVARIKTWWYDRWEGRWKGFQRGLPEGKETLAVKGDLLDGRFDYYQGLRKTESLITVQIRTGKIGLNHFLQTRRVPGVTSTSYLYGQRKQDVKHVFLFYPLYDKRRPRLI